MDIETLTQQAVRRQDILDHGCPLADLDEYSVLTLKMAEAVPGMLRAIKDVTALRDELARGRGETTVSAVARAFAEEIDRALKGQRELGKAIGIE